MKTVTIVNGNKQNGLTSNFSYIGKRPVIIYKDNGDKFDGDTVMNLRVQAIKNKPGSVGKSSHKYHFVFDPSIETNDERLIAFIKSEVGQTYMLVNNSEECPNSNDPEFHGFCKECCRYISNTTDHGPRFEKVPFVTYPVVSASQLASRGNPDTKAWILHRFKSSIDDFEDGRIEHYMTVILSKNSLFTSRLGNNYDGEVTPSSKWVYFYWDGKRLYSSTNSTEIINRWATDNEINELVVKIKDVIEI